MILNAKCHAIRDAQILEKKVINGEMQVEEKRLDQMMEIDRQNAIKMQEEIERKRREERWVIFRSAYWFIFHWHERKVASFGGL